MSYINKIKGRNRQFYSGNYRTWKLQYPTFNNIEQPDR